MAKTDQAGRPIVVVTGMGVITSLGAGREDNWRKLTAGESGIHEIKRISTEGLKTRIAGTIDFIPVDYHSSPGLSERLAEMAAEEAIAQSNIGSRGDFPGPAVHRGRADRDRVGPTRRAGARVRREWGAWLRGPDAGGRDRKFPPHLRTLPVRLGRRQHRGALRHQGIADLALDCLRVRRLGDPARRRGDPARRGERRFVHRHRRLGERRVADPLLAPFGALDQQRSAASRLAPVLEGSRWLRDG